MEFLGDNANSVGISNPGFWGMNIELGKRYMVVFYIRSTTMIDLTISFVRSNGGIKLASTVIQLVNTSTWRRVEQLEADATIYDASLQITRIGKGVVWLDQVSAMPLDTYKGHGFRMDLFQMVANLKPSFLRFPGGCFVEGKWLRSGFQQWKYTIGKWEQRPGHFSDIWDYWTDDGLGYFEYLQLAEDLTALPIWVTNNGISHHDQVNTSAISPFVQDPLDGIEFARGAPTSTWGSIRAVMGHPGPFDLRYVAIENEDCIMFNYQGSYLKFHDANKYAYPDIQVIANCDATVKPLNHLADLYDYHIYPNNSNEMFHKAQVFDHASGIGPKAFVSEYAMVGKEAGMGNLLAALSEALEK